MIVSRVPSLLRVQSDRLRPQIARQWEIDVARSAAQTYAAGFDLERLEQLDNRWRR